MDKKTEDISLLLVGLFLSAWGLAAAIKGWEVLKPLLLGALILIVVVILLGVGAFFLYISIKSLISRTHDSDQS